MGIHSEMGIQSELSFQRLLPAAYLLVLGVMVGFFLSGCSKNEDPWCSTTPSCLPGQVKIESEADCPAGDKCYESAICGQSIWCATNSISNCMAEPTCQDGHQQVASQAECQVHPNCYHASECGKTIWCSDETSSASCSGSCTPGETCDIPPPPGTEMRNVGCVCTTGGLYICDTDVNFNQAEIACGALTCGSNEYCAHVCDCCGVASDGAVTSGHDECRPCDGAACPYMRVMSIPCA